MKSVQSLSSHVIDLDSGQTLAPGEVVKLSDEALKKEHNKRQVEDGTLVVLDDKKEGK